MKQGAELGGVAPEWEEHVVHPSIEKSIESRPAFPTTVAMDITRLKRRLLPNLQFRVLVIGRANAGKTTILQRVCETTESPTIYRGSKEVRGPSFCLTSQVLLLPKGYTQPVNEC